MDDLIWTGIRADVVVLQRPAGELAGEAPGHDVWCGIWLASFSYITVSNWSYCYSCSRCVSDCAQAALALHVLSP